MTVKFLRKYPYHVFFAVLYALFALGVWSSFDAAQRASLRGKYVPYEKRLSEPLAVTAAFVGNEQERQRVADLVRKNETENAAPARDLEFWPWFRHFVSKDGEGFFTSFFVLAATAILLVCQVPQRGRSK